MAGTCRAPPRVTVVEGKNGRVVVGRAEKKLVMCVRHIGRNKRFERKYLQIG